MRRQRNAKIIANLGPARAHEHTIRALAEAGADAFRINFSHGAHAEHEQRVALERGFAVPGELMLIAAGIPFGEAGTTNLVHITRA